MTKQVESNKPDATVDLAEVRARVRAESARLRAKLPALLPLYTDQWVVFRDGEVVSVHVTDEEAYVAGLERFGPRGGHIIAQIREPEIITI